MAGFGGGCRRRRRRGAGRPSAAPAMKAASPGPRGATGTSNRRSRRTSAVSGPRPARAARRASPPPSSPAPGWCAAQIETAGVARRRISTEGRSVSRTRSGAAAAAARAAARAAAGTGTASAAWKARPRASSIRATSAMNGQAASPGRSARKPGNAAPQASSTGERGGWRAMNARAQGGEEVRADQPRDDREPPGERLAQADGDGVAMDREAPLRLAGRRGQARGQGAAAHPGGEGRRKVGVSGVSRRGQGRPPGATGRGAGRRAPGRGR